jgi:hypothetical protein
VPLTTELLLTQINAPSDGTVLRTELVQSYTALAAERHLKKKKQRGSVRVPAGVFSPTPTTNAQHAAPPVVNDDALLPSAADDNTASVSG